MQEDMRSIDFSEPNGLEKKGGLVPTLFEPKPRKSAGNILIKQQSKVKKVNEVNNENNEVQIKLTDDRNSWAINFDKIFSFTYYFPNNNIENVIHMISLSKRRKKI